MAGCVASNTRGFDIDLAHARFQAVRLKLVHVRAECVRFDNLSAGAHVLIVDFTHQIGRDQVQLVVGSIDVDAL